MNYSRKKIVGITLAVMLYVHPLLAFKIYVYGWKDTQKEDQEWYQKIVLPGKKGKKRIPDLARFALEGKEGKVKEAIEQAKKKAGLDTSKEPAPASSSSEPKTKAQKQIDRSTKKIAEVLGSAISMSQAREALAPFINEADVDGVTALHYAMHIGFINIIKILLEYGARLDAKDRYGRTPLHWAFETSKRGILVGMMSKLSDGAILTMFGDRLKEKNKDGVPMIDIGDNLGRTPLHWAVAQVNYGLVDALLDAGANPTIPDVFGFTPLHYACGTRGIKKGDKTPEQKVALLLKENTPSVAKQDQKFLKLTGDAFIGAGSNLAAIAISVNIMRHVSAELGKIAVRNALAQQTMNLLITQQAELIAQEASYNMLAALSERGFTTAAQAFGASMKNMTLFQSHIASYVESHLMSKTLIVSQTSVKNILSNTAAKAATGLTDDAVGAMANVLSREITQSTVKTIAMQSASFLMANMATIMTCINIAGILATGAQLFVEYYVKPEEQREKQGKLHYKRDKIVYRFVTEFQNRGISLSRQTPLREKTPWHIAAWTGNEEVIRVLEGKSTEMDQMMEDFRGKKRVNNPEKPEPVLDSSGYSALHDAVISGDEKTVKKLAKYDDLRELVDFSGSNPLLFSLKFLRMNPESTALLKAGSSYTTIDSLGCGSMHYAALQGVDFLARELINMKKKDGRRVSRTIPEGLRKELKDLMAAQDKVIEEADKRYEYGVLDPLYKDFGGTTPLHLAAASHSKIMSAFEYYVKELKVSPFEKDEKGNIKVTSGGSWSGQYVPITDNKGWNILHYAAYYGNKHTIKYILKQKKWLGALNRFTRPTPESNKGYLPMQLAARAGHKDVVKMLEPYSGGLTARPELYKTQKELALKKLEEKVAGMEQKAEDAARKKVMKKGEKKKWSNERREEEIQKMKKQLLAIGDSPFIKDKKRYSQLKKEIEQLKKELGKND